jgi:hypothetical protein
MVVLSRSLPFIPIIIGILVAFRHAGLALPQCPVVSLLTRALASFLGLCVIGELSRKSLDLRDGPVSTFSRRKLGAGVHAPRSLDVRRAVRP